MVEYDWEPTACKFCKAFGHNPDIYPYKSSSEDAAQIIDACVADVCENAKASGSVNQECPVQNAEKCKSGDRLTENSCEQENINGGVNVNLDTSAISCTSSQTSESEAPRTKSPRRNGDSMENSSPVQIANRFSLLSGGNSEF